MLLLASIDEEILFPDVPPNKLISFAARLVSMEKIFVVNHSLINIGHISELVRKSDTKKLATYAETKG